jgi:uncharacterized protein YdhG (YjbR/CyaY superfamily)
MKKTDIPVVNIDSYLALVPGDYRAALQNLREIIKGIVPEAEEVITYQIPAFKLHGALVGFAAFKNHCSFFIMHGSLLEMFKDELNDFKIAQSTVQFTPDKPIPTPLIEKMVRAKLAYNIQAAKEKAEKKTAGKKSK